MVWFADFVTIENKFKCAGNNIGDEGIIAFGKALPSNSTIVSLEICGKNQATYYILFLNQYIRQ